MDWGHWGPFSMTLPISWKQMGRILFGMTPTFTEKRKSTRPTKNPKQKSLKSMCCNIYWFIEEGPVRGDPGSLDSNFKQTMDLRFKLKKMAKFLNHAIWNLNSACLPFLNLNKGYSIWWSGLTNRRPKESVIHLKFESRIPALPLESPNSAWYRLVLS